MPEHWVRRCEMKGCADAPVDQGKKILFNCRAVSWWDVQPCRLKWRVASLAVAVVWWRQTAIVMPSPVDRSNAFPREILR